MDTMEMRIADLFASEMAHEAISTRKMLERVPEDQLGWKPHDKSMTLGFLATHISQIPFWGTTTLTSEKFVFDENTPKTPEATSRAELLEKFDTQLADFQQALREYPNDQMMVPWRLLVGDHVVFELPRFMVIRSMVLSHLIHHRGQLSVYLRMLDVPLPSVYGPSADEQ